MSSHAAHSQPSLVAPGAPARRTRWSDPATLLPGAGAALLVAAAATALARVVPLGSGPILGIVLGLAVTIIAGPRARLRPGLTLLSNVPLRAAVVVLGAELPLGTVLAQGARSLPVIVLTLGGCLITARWLGARLGVERPLRTLIACGTGICGASAIAAVTPVIAAGELEVGYAVATIFLFNVLAVLSFPLLDHLLGLGPHAFGVFSGTAVNDLSSVVAAANAYGGSALHTAVIVKLTRTLMIVPICVVLANRSARSGEGPVAPAGSGARPVTRAASVVPGFLILFLCCAGLRTVGAVPHGWAPAISQLATWLITIALSAIGLSIDLSALRRVGAAPVAFGAALWVTVTSLSLLAIGLGLG
jgi:uncharacterized integral membrane protein (TIGR00698 family)